jgi:putative DNA primase/helicase
MLAGWFMVDSINLNDAEKPKQPDDDIIKELAALKPLEYDRLRGEKAKAMNVRPATLDAQVKAERESKQEAKRLPFDEIEPCQESINPAILLDEIAATIQKFIVLNSQQAHAAALWVAFTWFIDVLEIAPLAIINAPEKSCGKTQLLTVLGRMAFRPLHAANASPSALFRAVDLWKPTLLIDEADTFFKDNAELHGMVNAGYLRDGFVLRSEAIGDSYEPKAFPVFSAKAIAGVALEKHLPDTTMSRGIVFNLRRKLPHESVDRLRHADKNLFTGIASKLARFAADYSQQVREARPILPEELSDRNQDNWDGLLAVASCAGDGWLQKATAAALQLSGDCEKSHSISNELLADIQDIFETKHVNYIRTTDLITALCEDEENAWATYNRGKPITARQVNKQLSAYDISSTRLRPNGNDNPIRGFELSQFDEVFKRYLGNDDGTPPKLSGTVAQNSANVDVARVTAVPCNKSVPAQNDLIRHRNQLINKPVPPCAGTEKLSGTTHVIDINKDSGICATVPDKNGVPERTQSSKHDVGRI